MNTIRSRRSYLIKPYYDWITDSGLTPYLSVNATYPHTKVPEKFIQNGQIVLNIKPAAIRNFSISNTHIEFQATFGGVEEHISIPLPAVKALFAKENQDGIAFDEQDDEGETSPAGGKSGFRVI